jgi:hypothetical protein
MIRKSAWSLSILAIATHGVASALARGDEAMRCSIEKVVDSQRTGEIAFTYLVPEGWKSTSSLNWNQGSFTEDFTAKTADGLYSVEQMQPYNMTYVANNGQATQGFRLTKAVDYLHWVISGLQQKGLANNVRILDEQNADAPLTEVEKNLPNQLPSIGGMRQGQFNQTAFIKVSFVRNGQEMIGNLGTTVFARLLTNNMQLGIGSTARAYSTETDTYVVGPTLFVLTPSNPTAQKVKEGQVIADSCRMTPEFMLYCAKLALGISDAELTATSERGKQLIRQMQANRDQIKKNFDEQIERKDTFTHEFCNYLMDQQDYQDGAGNILTVPNTFGSNWSDGAGHVLVSDETNFVPGQGWGTGWQRMSKAP